LCRSGYGTSTSHANTCRACGLGRLNWLGSAGTRRSQPGAGFLAALDKASISYHSGPEAIAAARQVCDWINQGQPRSDVIKSVSAGNPGFTMSGAAEFTTLAEGAYCPQHPGEPAAQQPSPPPPSWYQIQFPLPTFG
jgi:hypothetical protein